MSPVKSLPINQLHEQCGPKFTNPLSLGLFSVHFTSCASRTVAQQHECFTYLTFYHMCLSGSRYLGQVPWSDLYSKVSHKLEVFSQSTILSDVPRDNICRILKVINFSWSGLTFSLVAICCNQAERIYC